MKLTPEIEAIILAYIEAGASDYVAAEAAGIDERTFRDYLARGQGTHPTRVCTPQLKRFAQAVMEAKARARVAVEVKAAEDHVRFWLTHMARSKPGREGWTEPVPEDGAQGVLSVYSPSLEEAAETLRVLLEAGVLSVQDGRVLAGPGDAEEASGG